MIKDPALREPPLFVVGTQRSGTTLLCRMLNAHPLLLVQNELSVRKIFVPPLDAASIMKRMHQLAALETGQSVTTMLEKTGKRRWGLKDPELTDYLDQLEVFLPEARFLIIVRDPRAVVASYMENKWGLGTNAWTGALRWQREVSSQLDFAARHPSACMVFRYEDLVKEGKLTLQRICDFLEVGFDMKMLDHRLGREHYALGRENLQTALPLDSKMTDKWMQRLTLRERAWIVAECIELMEYFGYTVTEGPARPGKMMRQLLGIHQRVIGELQLQYRLRGIPLLGSIRALMSRRNNT